VVIDAEVTATGLGGPEKAIPSVKAEIPGYFADKILRFTGFGFEAASES